MLTEVEGFILSETPYGETSKIINVFTQEYGVIGIMCKGAKSMKSKLRAVTQCFTYGVFNLYYKKDKLSTLVSVDIKNPLKRIRNDLELISYLTYLSDLTSQVFKENPSKNVYQMFITTILKIEDGLDPMVLTNILEIKYLPLLGVGLNLEECAKCSSKKDIVTIDASYGGIICKNCYENQPIVDIKVIKLLRMFSLVDINSISTIDVKNDCKEIINMFIDEYYESFTGIYLNSKKFLENLLSN